MAPSSARRQSARKRQPSARQRGQNAPASSSPSRPPKRRKVNAAPARVEAEPEPMDEAPDEETSEDEQITSLSEAADKVAEVLEEAKEISNVAREHANESTAVSDRSISAYAKIAGRVWTYYVRDPTIHIGRRPDAKQSIEGQNTVEPSDSQTHIDLGPSKHVSRLHATVYFDPTDENWYIEVGGRNGVRVDEVLLRKGNKMALRSGNVLRIDDTEMIFVLPDVQAIVHETYLNRLNQPTRSKAVESSSHLHSHPVAAIFQHGTHVSPYAVPSINGHASSDGAPNTGQRQTTPVNPIMQAPYLSQNAPVPAQASTTPQRGPPVVMENSEHPIDYSDESMKDVKPPMSYATLIAQAILAGPNEKSSLNGIYEWIKSNFAYYRHLEAGWQNSIRHNLSLNQAFHRVGRDTHEPGKGGLWYIAEDRVEEFRKQGLKMTSRGGARQSSNPSSPVPKRSPRKKTPPRRAAQPQLTADGDSVRVTEAQTPSKGLRAVHGLADTQALPHLSSDASPLPGRPGFSAQTAGGSGSMDSPAQTMVSTSGLGFLTSGPDGDGGFGSLFTPAPQRHEPRMMAPSTAKLPSKYLPQSSPAPFWKNAGGTPLLPETSPAKGNGDPDRTRLGLQSSSPPPPSSANGSPIRVRMKIEANSVPPPIPRPPVPPSSPPAMAPPAASHGVPAEDEDEDEEQLDLMGNFPKIGQSTSNTAR